MTQVTSGDLMVFLEGFKSSMEAKIEHAKETIEDKIDGRLNNIDAEIRKINGRMTDTDEVNRRMDTRLMALEREMEKATDIRRRSSELRRKEQNLGAKNQETLRQKPKDKVIQKDPSIQIVNNENTEIATGPFRSTWARTMERELQQAASVEYISSRETRGSHQTSQPAGREKEQQNPGIDYWTNNPGHWNDRDWQNDRREDTGNGN